MTIINGGSHRYLGELAQFKNGLPHGVVNKTKTDVGGTFVAATCDSNYIVVCPFVDLVKSIGTDKNVKKKGIEVFMLYGDQKIKQGTFNAYLRRNEGKPLKIAVTYDSLPKLIRWMDYNVDGWKLLVDEYHMILEDFDFRTSAIEKMLEEVKRFKHYTFLSATPTDPKYEIEFFKELPHYKVIWNNYETMMVHRYRVPRMEKAVAQMIKNFMKNGLSAVDVNGEEGEIKELYIFMNSVTRIK